MLAVLPWRGSMWCGLPLAPRSPIMLPLLATTLDTPLPPGLLLLLPLTLLLRRMPSVDTDRLGRTAPPPLPEPFGPAPPAAILRRTCCCRRCCCCCRCCCCLCKISSATPSTLASRRLLLCFVLALVLFFVLALLLLLLLPLLLLRAA